MAFRVRRRLLEISIIKKHNLVATFSFVALLPIIFFSQGIADSALRDNYNYLHFYSRILDNGLSFVRSYLQFKISTGASEPLSFFYFYSAASLGLSYGMAVFIKNISFAAVIVGVLKRYFGQSWLVVIYLIYLATNYYLFRLMGELHRLSLALLVLLAASLLIHRFKLIGYLAASLMHLQVILLSPILIMLGRNRFKIFAMLLLVVPAAAYFGKDKILYYLSFDILDIVRFLFLSLIFLLVSVPIGKQMIKTIAVISIAMMPAIIMFGTDRVIIMYWEIILFSIFSTAVRGNPKRKKFLAFYVLIFSLLIPYNIYRITNDLQKMQDYNFVEIMTMPV
ncbi:hypothetical protein N9M89_02675 [Amylibacter sp.]|jgi:hypothetical protein|nr:hypothetical protein [Amylibacter sp.]